MMVGKVVEILLLIWTVLSQDGHWRFPRIGVPLVIIYLSRILPL